MTDARYAYSMEPTRNPFRYLLALVRTLRDPTDTAEVAIVEAGFARSRLGRRLARWDEVAAALRSDPRTAPAFLARRPCAPIELEPLAQRAPGTLGNIFAAHCRARNLNPNLAYVPPDGDVGWMLHHLLLTHDVWHVVTGWGNDEIGEYGLGSFYMGQLSAPSFFGYLLALALISSVMRRRSLATFMEAVTRGYEMGRRAEPLFGMEWSDLWDVPLDEIRARLRIDATPVIGEGIRVAA